GKPQRIRGGAINALKTVQYAIHWLSSKPRGLRGSDKFNSEDTEHGLSTIIVLCSKGEVLITASRCAFIFDIIFSLDFIIDDAHARWCDEGTPTALLRIDAAPIGGRGDVALDKILARGVPARKTMETSTHLEASSRLTTARQHAFVAQQLT
ncbi:hypothetical protein FOZ62_010031, partial [Perkinsus olseni]